MTYLFFDIECANSFGGIGKICSFGYVLCQEAEDGSGFTVLETDDILMNPQAPFDWYLFKPGSKCRLSYSKEEYRSRPPFSAFYQRIQDLLSADDRRVIGFGCRNDVAAIVSESLRYQLPLPRLAVYDIHPLLEQFYQSQGGLGAFVEKLGIDSSGLPFHDSRADAYFTMKVTEKLMADSKKSGAGLLKALSPLTGDRAFADLKRKLFRKQLERQEGEKARDAGSKKKPRPVPKKIRVPESFDWEKEFRYQIESHSKQR